MSIVPLGASLTRLAQGTRLLKLGVWQHSGTHQTPIVASLSITLDHHTLTQQQCIVLLLLRVLFRLLHAPHAYDDNSLTIYERKQNGIVMTWL